MTMDRSLVGMRLIEHELAFIKEVESDSRGWVTLGHRLFQFDRANAFLYGVPLVGLDLKEIFTEGTAVYIEAWEEHRVSGLWVGSRELYGQDEYTALLALCQRWSLSESIRDNLEQRASNLLQGPMLCLNCLGLPGRLIHLESSWGVLQCSGHLMEVTDKMIYMFGVPMGRICLQSILKKGVEVKVDFEAGELRYVYVGTANPRAASLEFLSEWCLNHCSRSPELLKLKCRARHFSLLDCEDQDQLMADREEKEKAHEEINSVEETGSCNEQKLYNEEPSNDKAIQQSDTDNETSEDDDECDVECDDEEIEEEEVEEEIFEQSDIDDEESAPEEGSLACDADDEISDQDRSHKQGDTHDQSSDHKSCEQGDPDDNALNQNKSYQQGVYDDNTSDANNPHQKCDVADEIGATEENIYQQSNEVVCQQEETTSTTDLYPIEEMMKDSYRTHKGEVKNQSDSGINSSPRSVTSEESISGDFAEDTLISSSPIPKPPSSPEQGDGDKMPLDSSWDLMLEDLEHCLGDFLLSQELVLEKSRYAAHCLSRAFVSRWRDGYWTSQKALVPRKTNQDQGDPKPDIVSDDKRCNIM